MVFDKKLWELYIEAQRKILVSQSGKFQIEDYELIDNGTSLKLQLHQEDLPSIAQAIIAKHLSQGRVTKVGSEAQLLLPTNLGADSVMDKIRALKNTLEEHFFEIDELPIFTIVLSFDHSKNDRLKKYYRPGLEHFKLTRQELSDLLTVDSGLNLAKSVAVRIPVFSKKNVIKSYSEVLSEAGFDLSVDKMIKFSFKDIGELDRKIAVLESIPLNYHAYWNEEFQYTVFLYEAGTDLSLLRQEISDKIKSKNGRLFENQEPDISRICVSYYASEEGKAELREFIDYVYQQTQDRNIKIDLINETEYTFVLRYNKKGAHEALRQQQKFLLGAEILWNEQVLGKVTKISKKYLSILLNLDLKDSIRQGLANKSLKITSVTPQLRGELDKIHRLAEVTRKMADDQVSSQNKEGLVNPRLRDYFFDSSRAKPIDASWLIPGNPKYQDVLNYAQSHTLNSSQWRAVASALYANDMALIQGPPGTGKSTVIAEIVWQHLVRRPEQLLLLTSESHLAVDNAIERMVERYNIVKPVRFGSSDKLVNEGKRFSLDRITAWVHMDAEPDDSESQLEDEDTNTDDNILRIWFDNIIRRSRMQSGNNDDSPVSQWNNYLATYPDDLKTLFFNKYLDHVNLIGSTSSAIGERNELDVPTRFYRQWKKTFAKKPGGAADKIRFDVAIIDEASKATPPELALPLTYAEKGIIVGDHRQLPPMLDGNDFETALTIHGEKDLLTEFKKYDASTSHFEKLFTNPNLPPTLKTTFDTQFRMHPAIGAVIQQFYREDLGEAGLLCGLDPAKVDQHFDDRQSRYHGLQLDGFIQPDQHCIWVNVESPEMQINTTRVNYGEVEAVRWVLDSIGRAEGFRAYRDWVIDPARKPEEAETGIISFYGGQIAALRANIDGKMPLPVRINTVDAFQGMERNIVIVSMVRSNTIVTSWPQKPDYNQFEKGYPPQSELGFAQSPNRLNVALSRAKRLLIIVGNAAHFSQKAIYANVIRQINESGSVINFSSISRHE